MNHKEIERWYRLKLIKRTAQVLVLVAVTALVAGYAVSRILLPDDNDRPLAETHHPGPVLKKIEFSMPGVHPLELKADAALGSEKLDSVELIKPEVVFTGKRGEKILLTADFGKLDKKTRSVHVRGSVVIRMRGFVIKADEIRYSDESGLAETPTRFSLEGKDMRLRGRGMKLSVQDSEVSIEHDVHSELFGVDWLPPGAGAPQRARGTLHE
jgi:LPS export ABC transporter protein LptC